MSLNLLGKSFKTIHRIPSDDHNVGYYWAYCIGKDFILTNLPLNSLNRVAFCQKCAYIPHSWLWRQCYGFPQYCQYKVTSRTGTCMHEEIDFPVALCNVFISLHSRWFNYLWVAYVYESKMIHSNDWRLFQTKFETFFSPKMKFLDKSG